MSSCATTSLARLSSTTALGEDPQDVRLAWTARYEVFQPPDEPSKPSFSSAIHLIHTAFDQVTRYASGHVVPRRVFRVQIGRCSDTSLINRLDRMTLERSLVSLVPILHGILPLQVSNNECNRNLLLKEEFIK